METPSKCFSTNLYYTLWYFYQQKRIAVIKGNIFNRLDWIWNSNRTQRTESRKWTSIYWGDWIWQCNWLQFTKTTESPFINSFHRVWIVSDISLFHKLKAFLSMVLFHEVFLIPHSFDWNTRRAWSFFLWTRHHQLFWGSVSSQQLQFQVN